MDYGMPMDGSGGEDRVFSSTRTLKIDDILVLRMLTSYLSGFRGLKALGARKALKYEPGAAKVARPGTSKQGVARLR